MNIIPITSHRVEDLRIQAARTEGFGMAVKAMMDKINAASGTFTKEEIKFALLLLHPEK